MIFSSIEFLVFFSVFFVFFLVLKGNWRVWLIIGGSGLFYSVWNLSYAFMPFLLVLIAWGGSHWTEAEARPEARRLRLFFTLLVLCLPLLYTKYHPFLNNSVCALAGCELLPKHAIPLGISFITFTLIAYVVDIDEGRYRRESGLPGILGLTLFFPHLIAGPILRPGELIPQILRKAVSLRRLSVLFPIGLTLFAVGFVKKLVFADQIAVVVDKLYSAPLDSLTAPDALVAMVGFSVQIFCDFSGYTDMALGAALILGVRLPENFHAPYCAVSPQDFWRRWHVTLSRWLRDYIYIRLGGNRCSPTRRTANVVATMAIGGMWHGANWTFLIWGLFHGLGIVLAPLWQRLGAFGRPGRMAAVATTFAFVTIGWVFFRATSIDQAWAMIAALGRWPVGAVDRFEPYAYEIILMALVLGVHRFDHGAMVRHWAARRRRWQAITVAAAAMGLAWLLSASGSAKFIYFDF